MNSGNTEGVRPKKAPSKLAFVGILVACWISFDTVAAFLDSVANRYPHSGALHQTIHIIAMAFLTIGFWAAPLIYLRLYPGMRFVEVANQVLHRRKGTLSLQEVPAAEIFRPRQPWLLVAWASACLGALLAVLVIAFPCPYPSENYGMHVLAAFFLGLPAIAGLYVLIANRLCVARIDAVGITRYGVFKRGFAPWLRIESCRIEETRNMFGDISSVKYIFFGARAVEQVTVRAAFPQPAAQERFENALRQALGYESSLI